MDHPDQYKSLLIRTPAHIHNQLKELARKSGTDLTGYINAVVFTNHIKQNDKTIITDGSKPGEPRTS